jgi:hypothetical protein
MFVRFFLNKYIVMKPIIILTLKKGISYGQESSDQGDGSEIHQ